MVVLILVGRIDIINRAVHTIKLARILSGVYSKVSLIIESSNELLVDYMTRKIDFPCSIYVLKPKPWGKIPVALLNDLFSTIRLINTLKKIQQDDKIVYVKGSNVFLLLTKIKWLSDGFVCWGICFCFYQILPKIYYFT